MANLGYGALLDIHAGAADDVHLSCRESVEKIYGVEVPEKAPLAIVSAGGYPLDMSWVQTVKAFVNWNGVLEEEGWIIIIGECGGESFASKPNVHSDNMSKHPSLEQVESALKKDFTMEMYGLYRMLLITSKINIIPVSEMDDAMTKRMNMKIAEGKDATEKLKKAIEMAEAHIGKDYKYYLVNHGGSFLPVFRNI